MPPIQPISLGQDKALFVNDMQAGVLSPQEAIAFANPKAMEGLEEARGFIISRSGKSITIEPRIENAGSMMYEGDHFVIKRYRDSSDAEVAPGSYPSATGTWRLTDEYYIGNSECKTSGVFTRYTTTAPTIAGGSASPEITGPIGFRNNRKTISQSTVYDMKLDKYTAVNKIAQLTSVYKTRVIRGTDTGATSTLGDVKLTYIGSPVSIVTEVKPVTAYFRINSLGKTQAVKIFAYNVWVGDKPPTQIAKTIPYKRADGKKSAFVPVDHASLTKDGKDQGAIYTAAAQGPILTNASLTNDFATGPYAFDENDAALAIGGPGTITSLESAGYYYSATSYWCIPKSLSAYCSYTTGISDTEIIGYFNFVYDRTSGSYIAEGSSNYTLKVTSSGVAQPIGYSQSRRYMDSTDQYYAKYLPGSTVVIDTDVVQMTTESSVKSSGVFYLDNPFSGDIIGTSSFPSKIGSSNSVVFYFNGKTLVRGLRRFGPALVLGKTNGATGTQTSFGIGATHVAYADPYADASAKITDLINTNWPGALTPVVNVGKYQAPLDTTVWLYTDKTGSTGGFNGTGGTNGMGDASAYIASTDSEVMWIEQTYNGILFGTRTGEYLINDDQLATKFSVVKVSGTGSSAMSNFNRSTACIYKGNVFFVSNIGISSVQYSQEVNSYVPKSASFYGRINTGDIISIQSDELNGYIAILTYNKENTMVDLWYWFPEYDAVFKTNQTDFLNATSAIAYGLVKIDNRINIVIVDNFSSPTTFKKAVFSDKQPSSAGAFLRTTRFGMNDGRSASIKKIYATLINSYGGRYRVVADDSKQQIDFHSINYPIQYAESPYYTGVVEIYSVDSDNMRSTGKRIEIDVVPGEYVEISSIRAEVKV